MRGILDDTTNPSVQKKPTNMIMELGEGNP